RWNTFLIVPELHRLLLESQAGPNEIWITEYGAPTGSHSRSLAEADQATLILDALQAAADWPWTGPTFLYAFRDFRNDPENLEWNYGIVGNDGTPKQAWHELLSRQSQ
ncbi:MAG: beta-xylosidase, partial [Acidimicrobiales bacterium]